MNKETLATNNVSHKTAGDSVHEGVEYLKDKATSYEKSIMESLEPIQKRAQSIGNDVSSWVKENPVAAAGIALSAGVLIGRALISRTHTKN